MMEWLSANWGTIFAAAVLAVIVVLILCKVIKDKKAGRHSCGAGGAGCPMSGACHKR